MPPPPDTHDAAGPVSPSGGPGTDGDAGAAPTPWARFREGGRILAGLGLLALLIKLLVVAAALDQNPLGTHLTSDARYYVDRARGLAGRWDDPLADEAHHLPPLYPLILSVVPGAVDGEPGGVLLLQAVAGLALLAMVYLLGHRRGGVVAGLVAAGLTLAYGPLTYFETKLLGDQLATVLLVGLVLAGDGHHERPSHVRAGLLGLLGGLACLLRPQVLLVLPPLLVWVGRRRWPQALTLAVVAALTLAPAAWHNLSTTGQFVLISDNGGVNLWLANAGPPSGTFLTHDPEFGSIATQAAVARRRAEAAEGRDLGPAEVSRWWSGRAWQAIVDDPGLFLRRVGLRARALVESFETGVVVVPEVEAGLIPPLTLLALPFGVLLALFGAALVLGRRPGPGAPWLPSAAVAGMVVLTTLVFFHYSRFRLPLVPLMAVVVGRAVVAPRPTVPRVALALVLAGGLATLSWLPGSHHPGVLANGWTLVAEARRTRAGPADRETLTQALTDVERGLAADPGFLRAQIVAAELALALNRFDDCQRWLAGAEELAAREPSVLAARCLLSLQAHPANRHQDLERARTCLKELRLLALVDPALRDLVAFLEPRLAAAEGR